MRDEVLSASEMLGIDPYMVANEGKVIFAVKSEDAHGVLTSIKKTGIGENALICGEAIGEHVGSVVLETTIGGRKYMEMPVGDPVPRVC